MECPHLRGYRKVPAKGLIRPGNDGFPCGIDDPRVLSADDDLHSLIYDRWELCIEMSPIPGKEEARDSMPHSPESRRYCGYRLFFYQIKTIFDCLLWFENYCSVWFNGWLSSPTWWLPWGQWWSWASLGTRGFKNARPGVIYWNHPWDDSKKINGPNFRCASFLMLLFKLKKNLGITSYFIIF